MIRAALFGLIITASPLAAQQRAAAFSRWEVPRLQSAIPARDRGSSGGSALGMVGGGVLGGAVGLVAGGLVGAAIGGGNAICGDDACGLEEAAYGAIIGEATLLPLGVHLANRRRGNYALSLLASAAIGAAGVLAVDAANDGWPLIPVPIAQLITSIVIERATARP